MGDRLQDKVAIIMGAGQAQGETTGNGRAVALRFAQEGARVLLVDRDIESARQTLALVQADGGTGAVLEADATSEEDCQRVAAHCIDTHGRVDILHNNVGIGERGKGFLDIPTADWERFMDVNLKSMYLACKAVMPHMLRQQSGVVLNISSIASIMATGAVAYKSSKAAVNALTQGLAIEAAPHGVRVNAILPGLMDTPMAVEGRMRAWGQTREEVSTPRNARVPLKGGMGDAWDVANAAVFLASDEARFITGVLLPVDGGQLAKIG